MPEHTLSHAAAARRRSHPWTRWGVLLAVAVAIAFLGLPALAGVPAKLVEGCGDWIVTAGVLEVLSILGLVVILKLVFAAPCPGGGALQPACGRWRRPLCFRPEG
jgi:hypothetical protein